VNITDESLAAEPASLIAADEWDSRWQQTRYPLLLDFRAPGVCALADFFRLVLPHAAKTASRAGSLIEIGCGASAWLPFFAKEMGYRLAGIDYSPAGIHIVRKNLEVLGIDGHIVEGDLFNETLLPVGTFDVVYSSGFIEHFPQVNPVMRRFSNLLKPGGLMITIVPNLQGLPGFLQRRLDRAIYDQHVIMDAAGLERRHTDAGLTTVAGPVYLGGFDLWALNWGRVLQGRSRLFNRMLGKAGAAVNAGMNLGLQACGARDSWWSSQMIAIASRKGTS
jgi:SAM-dependent methyltransferase